MRICSIASGSSGNCIYVGSDDTHIIIDCGISGKRLVSGIQDMGLEMDDIDAVLVTHEHSDHIKGLGVISRKFGLPIYTAKKTFDAVLVSPGIGEIDASLLNEISPQKEFVIGDLNITPFSISHDAADPVGFRIGCGRKSCAVATDMGTFDSLIVSRLLNLDTVLLESNHDVNMLEAGRYPYPLKRRILSDRGHLSNEMAGHLLNEILHDDMKHIILGHLSAENNYPALAYETVCCEVTSSESPYRSSDFDIRVAKRDVPGDVIEW